MAERRNRTIKNRLDRPHPATGRTNGATAQCWPHPDRTCHLVYVVHREQFACSTPENFWFIGRLSICLENNIMLGLASGTLWLTLKRPDQILHRASHSRTCWTKMDFRWRRSVVFFSPTMSIFVWRRRVPAKSHNGNWFFCLFGPPTKGTLSTSIDLEMSALKIQPVKLIRFDKSPVVAVNCVAQETPRESKTRWCQKLLCSSVTDWMLSIILKQQSHPTALFISFFSERSPVIKKIKSPELFEQTKLLMKIAQSLIQCNFAKQWPKRRNRWA